MGGGVESGSMNAITPYITATELVVGYAHPLHQPVSFGLAAGDCLMLQGDNGSGKSSVIAALAGHARIWQGQLVVAHGVSMAHQAQQPVQRQEFPLSVREYLRLARVDLSGLPDRLRRVQSLVVGRLSGGQLQLLAIWAALAGPATVVLLDEPTNHLDQHGRACVADWLQQARRPEQALLLISHDTALQALATQQVQMIAAGHVAHD
jgi:ABC-2 type transport system ATP-binding protein